MTEVVWIQGGRLIDPAAGTDRVGDLRIEDGRLVEIQPGAAVPTHARVIDARGLTVVPGFIDLHVHLREPGGEDAETVASGTRAASAGGFAAVVAMPNTKPPIDTPEAVRLEIERARQAGYASVWPSACLTRGRAGREATDLEALAEAGAVCFTDDGCTVSDEALLREIMTEAARLGVVVMDHAQDPIAEKRGVMHDGRHAERWGLPGIPSSAEASVVARDIALSKETGAAMHIQHLTSRQGAELVRRARAEGVRVTAELTPHHLSLCDAEIDPANADYKMNPPLRSDDDRTALREAFLDGTISCFATDHAPHTRASKALGFLHAPFGVVGLETAVGVTYTHLVKAGHLDALEWVRRWTTAPAAVLGRTPPSLAPGAPADLALLDLQTPWRVLPDTFLSQSHNTPFTGWTLTGRAMCTLHRGRVVFRRVAE